MQKNGLTNSLDPDNLYSQTVGDRGPILLQDSVLHENLEEFVHTKIIERQVHVKGYGAFGFFQTTHSMCKYTKLCFLQTPGQQVPVTVRFSFAVSVQGTPDTTRTARGFSTKFYTEAGIFDLLCNHIPVLFVRDGMRFPQAINASVASPVNNLTYPERFWDFIATAPEAMNFIVRVYSDAGTLKSFRHMPGFSVNTYVWVNAEGERRFVKYHWRPLAGEQTITRQEATLLAGTNPDVAGEDLFNTIAAGQTVQYELCVQLMNPKDACGLDYDPLDDTKVWDEQHYPLIPVGRLVLNRNPDNYMEQVEKIAFNPSNLLDGAELSDDRVLQARANIYADAQRRRLGPDFRKFPINCQQNWSPDCQVTSGTGRCIKGELVRASIPDPDDFTQAGEYYQSLPPMQQCHLADNLAADLSLVCCTTLKIVLGYLHRVCSELGAQVAQRIQKLDSR